MSPSARLRTLHIINHLAFGVALCFGPWWLILASLAFWQFVATFGISIGYHRYLSHKSFRTSRPWHYFLLSIGMLAGGGSPLSWAGAHRMHHAFGDQERDPHSVVHLPKWKVYTHYWNKVMIPRKMIRDLLASPFLKFTHRHYFKILLGWAILMYLIDWRLGVVFYTGPAVFAFHAFGLINLFGHSHGYKNFETNDTSTNSWIANLLTAGEGWHNNHHRFPGLYRIGLRSGEWDISAWVLETLPIVRDQKKLSRSRELALSQL